MKTFISILFLVLFIGCSGVRYVGAKHQSGDVVIQIVEDKANCYIYYKSCDLMLKEIKTKAKSDIWSSKKFNREKSEIPLGGSALIYISSDSINAANTKWWEYIVQTLDGKEILHEQGIEDKPEPSLNIEKQLKWWNIHIIDFKDSLSSPIKVFVINKLLQVRSAFYIYPNK